MLCLIPAEGPDWRQLGGAEGMPHLSKVCLTHLDAPPFQVSPKAAPSSGV